MIVNYLSYTVRGECYIMFMLQSYYKKVKCGKI